jgi:hypothetical protein
MLGWFNTKEVDRFAQELVAEVKKRIPVSTLGTLDKKSRERVSRMTDVLSDQVRAFATSQRLNVYKRARLGSRVKWALKDAGYPESFVDAFTYELVTLVAVASSRR